jgi:hypothetical protein
MQAKIQNPGSPSGKPIRLKNKNDVEKQFFYTFALALSRGVTGNTSDSGSEEFRFDP